MIFLRFINGKFPLTVNSFINVKRLLLTVNNFNGKYFY